jgi:hypothetical protein
MAGKNAMAAQHSFRRVALRGLAVVLGVGLAPVCGAGAPLLAPATPPIAAAALPAPAAAPLLSDGGVVAGAGTPAVAGDAAVAGANGADVADLAEADLAAAAAGAADGGRPSLGSVLSGDGRVAWRTFSLFARQEVWPRQPGQWLYLGGLAGLSAVLENNKLALRRDVLRSAFYSHSQWTQIGGTLGLTHVAYGAAGALYLGGLIANQEEVRRTGLILAESVLVAQGVAGAVNFAVSEQRPAAGGAITFFHSGGSGVSIHMTNTMALARVLDHRLARFQPADSRPRRIAKILAKTVIYAIPSITGWQRLRADQHYLWSVVLGAGLSAFVTDAMLRSYDRAAAPPAPP